MKLGYNNVGNQTGVWKSGNGEEIPVASLKDSHLCNILFTMVRNADATKFNAREDCRALLYEAVNVRNLFSWVNTDDWNPTERVKLWYKEIKFHNDHLTRLRTKKMIGTALYLETYKKGLYFLEDGSTAPQTLKAIKEMNKKSEEELEAERQAQLELSLNGARKLYLEE